MYDDENIENDLVYTEIKDFDSKSIDVIYGDIEDPKLKRLAEQIEPLYYSKLRMRLLEKEILMKLKQELKLKDENCKLQKGINKTLKSITNTLGDQSERRESKIIELNKTIKVKNNIIQELLRDIK